MELARKIHDILSPYPSYVYNKYSSFYFHEMDKNYTDTEATYLARKQRRRNRLLQRMLQSGHGGDRPAFCSTPSSAASTAMPSASSISINVEPHDEYVDFADLIACLLDLNPSTRYTSEDAIQHPFCISLPYIQDDIKMISVLSSKYFSTYPHISISSDFDRQFRINQQIEQYNLNQRIEMTHPMSVVMPKEMATTRKANPFTVTYTNNLQQAHNRVICVLNGCCNYNRNKATSNTATVGQSGSETEKNTNDGETTSPLYKTSIPPLKKMKYNEV